MDTEKTNPTLEDLLNSDVNLTDEFKSAAKQLFDAAVAEEVAKKQEELKQEETDKIKELSQEEINKIRTEYEDKYNELVKKVADLEADKTSAAEKYEQELTHLSEEVDNLAVEKSTDSVNDLIDRLDEYASYVADQFIKSNEQKMENDAKLQVCDEFIKKVYEALSSLQLEKPEVKEVFEGQRAELEKQIEDVKAQSAAAYDQLAALLDKQSELEGKLNKAEQQVELYKECDDLTELDKSKVFKMMEDFEGSSEEFHQKVKSLKESVIKETLGDTKALSESITTVVTDQVPLEEQNTTSHVNLSPDVAMFVKQLEIGDKF